MENLPNATFRVKLENGKVYVELPPPEALDPVMGTEIGCQAAIIATGVSYRKLDVPGVEELTGAGVYYGSTNSEASFLLGRDAFVVGGANSAAAGGRVRSFTEPRAKVDAAIAECRKAKKAPKQH